MIKLAIRAIGNNSFFSENVLATVGSTTIKFPDIFHYILKNETLSTTNAARDHT